MAVSRGSATGRACITSRTFSPGRRVGPGRRAARQRAEALGDAGPVLDAEAKQAYRQRLTALRAELGDAETANDIGRAAAVREEIERLAEQLSAAVGLGGRDRRIGATAERARLTVTKRIKDALARIDRAESSLGAYLGRTIRTGLLCMYAPDAGDPVRWSL
jgi:non-specific serine/threonine protein kinase